MWKPHPGFQEGFAQRSEFEALADAVPTFNDLSGATGGSDRPPVQSLCIGNQLLVTQAIERPIEEPYYYDVHLPMEAEGALKPLAVKGWRFLSF